MSQVCPHGIHMDNGCGACVPPRGTTIRNWATPPLAATRTAAPDLMAAIMNLRGSPKAEWDRGRELAYKEGHRDARHAAAQLVSASTAAPVARSDEQSSVHPAAPQTSVASPAPLSEPRAIEPSARPVRLSDLIADAPMPPIEGASWRPSRERYAQMITDTMDDEPGIMAAGGLVNTGQPLPRHKFWGAGEPDCPADLKAPNGELHTMRCKACGDGWRKSIDVCFAGIATPVVQQAGDKP